MRRTFLNRPFKYRFFYATLILATLNVLIFFASLFNQRIQIYLGLSVLGCIEYNMWWQPITYMFIHSGWEHIVCNMLGLLIFGLSVERAIGSWEFITFYFICGIFDGFISLLIYYFTGTNILLVGASGAVYSILLMFATLFPQSKVYIWGIIPLHAPVMVILYTGIEIVSQFIGTSNVAHLTHLTGFAMAFIYLLVRMRVNPIKVWLNAYRR